MNITFHIGAPRTGSTSIQNALNGLRSQKGFPFERVREKRSHLSWCLRFFPFYPNCRFIGRLASYYPKLLLSLRELQGERELVLSEENFAGDMLGPSKELFDNCDLCFCFLQSIAENHDCKLILFARRIDEYVKSCYKFRLQRGEGRKIDEFVHSLHHERLQWKHFVQKAERYGLGDRLYVVDFDSYFKNRQNFDFSELPGIFGSDYEIKRSNHSAVSPVLLSFLRRLGATFGSSLYRASEVESLVEEGKELELLMLAKQRFKDHSLVDRCYAEASQNKEENDFSDVIMSEELTTSLHKISAQEASYLAESTRCFGDFSSWSESFRKPL